MTAFVRPLAGALAALGSLSLAAPAFAHHAMGGVTPSNAFEGFVSGLAHPVIGIDHLAFVVSVGVAAAFMARRLLSPLAFVGATLVGCMISVVGASLPLAELVITLSVVLVGGIVLSGRGVSAGLLTAIFAAAGVFHGAAYGEAIVGAETGPLLAYLLGFGAIQYGIAVAAGFVAATLAKGEGRKAVEPRLAGAMAAGVGFAFFVENVEGMMFA